MDPDIIQADPDEPSPEGPPPALEDNRDEEDGWAWTTAVPQTE